MALITRKTGDTLIFRGQYRDANGDLVDLMAGGITIRSSIRSGQNQSRAFDCEVDDQVQNPGGFRLTMQTAGLDAGDYLWDVRYQVGDIQQSTETKSIRLADAITP